VWQQCKFGELEERYISVVPVQLLSQAEEVKCIQIPEVNSIAKDNFHGIRQALIS